jgi:hypothetical protein
VLRPKQPKPPRINRSDEELKGKNWKRNQFMARAQKEDNCGSSGLAGTGCAMRATAVKPARARNSNFPRKGTAAPIQDASFFERRKMICARADCLQQQKLAR